MILKWRLLDYETNQRMEFHQPAAEPITEERGGEIRSTMRKIPIRLNQMAFMVVGYLAINRKLTISIIRLHW